MATKNPKFVMNRILGIPTVPQFVVLVSTTKPSAQCFGSYVRVAVIETNRVDMPTQIHPHHKAVVAIKRTWENCNVGKTPRCASARAIAAAREMAQHLNNTVTAK